MHDYQIKLLQVVDFLYVVIVHASINHLRWLLIPCVTLDGWIWAYLRWLDFMIDQVRGQLFEFKEFWGALFASVKQID